MRGTTELLVFDGIKNELESWNVNTAGPKRNVLLAVMRPRGHVENSTVRCYFVGPTHAFNGKQLTLINGDCSQ